MDKMAIPEGFFKAKEEFIQEYLIEKPKRYGVDMFLLSASRVGSPEETGAANIVGVGIGEKHIGGIPSGQPALRVYVAEKYPEKVKDMPVRSLHSSNLYGCSYRCYPCREADSSTSDGQNTRVKYKLY